MFKLTEDPRLQNIYKICKWQIYDSDLDCASFKPSKLLFFFTLLFVFLAFPLCQSPTLKVMLLLETVLKCFVTCVVFAEFYAFH